MAVGYGICDLGEDVKRTFPVLTPARLKTPFQRYIKLASACIIALWLLAMAFLIWERRENGKLPSQRYINTNQGLLLATQLLTNSSCDRGTREMEISRFKCFKDISNQSGLALSQGGCWLWLFWFGRRRETDISRFKVTSQQLYGWHHCSMAVNIC